MLGTFSCLKLALAKGLAKFAIVSVLKKSRNPGQFQTADSSWHYFLLKAKPMVNGNLSIVKSFFASPIDGATFFRLLHFFLKLNMGLISMKEN